MVVLAADDRGLVVGHLGGAHRAEPGHDQVPAEVPLAVVLFGQPQVATVFVIGRCCRAGGCRL
jgi:hypothetical protein